MTISFKAEKTYFIIDVETEAPSQTDHDLQGQT